MQHFGRFRADIEPRLKRCILLAHVLVTKVIERKEIMQITPAQSFRLSVPFEEQLIRGPRWTQSFLQCRATCSERLFPECFASIGLDSHLFGTHSLRRTKATVIYRRTGNL
jgi:hypothetical protein